MEIGIIWRRSPATAPTVVSSLGMLRAGSISLRALRTIAVILAIASMLCVSAASVSAGHTHANQPIDQCSVCCTAHMAVQQVAVIQVAHAPELQSILSMPVAIKPVESRGVLAFFNRGPPSSL
jgi:hypothetical protein